MLIFLWLVTDVDEVEDLQPVDRIQNIQNSDIDSMKKAINAILHHMIKDNTMSLVQQHMYCRRHSKTRCKFWLDKLHGKGTYDESSW